MSYVTELLSSVLAAFGLRFAGWPDRGIYDVQRSFPRCYNIPPLRIDSHMTQGSYGGRRSVLPVDRMSAIAFLNSTTSCSSSMTLRFSSFVRMLNNLAQVHSEAMPGTTTSLAKSAKSSVAPVQEVHSAGITRPYRGRVSVGMIAGIDNARYLLSV